MYIIVFLIAIVIVALYLASSLWGRRDASGARYLLILILAAAVWSTAYAAELVADDLETKLLWAKVEYIGIVVIAPAWFLFAVLYTARSTWFIGSSRKIALLAIIPIITLALVWTNESHGLIWSQTALDTSAPLSTLELAYGTWFWIHTSYSYLLLLIGSIWFVVLIQQATHFFRWQVGAILFGISVPWIANLLSITGLIQFNLDLTPFAFIITGLAFAFSLYRYRMLDIIPFARQTVVDLLIDPVIVLDSEKRIVDTNPATRQLTNLPNRELIGLSVDQILGHHADLENLFSDLHSVQTEIPITVSIGQQYFDTLISPLNDHRKSVIGWLVVLHDITLRKSAEDKLRYAKDNLELMVARRTAELEDANQQIREELKRRQLAEQRYRTLFQEAPVMYVITREQQGTPMVVDCNQLFLESLGYQREEILERPLADFYAATSNADLEQGYLRAMREEVVIEERQLLTRQGQVIETLLNVAPEFDQEGNVLGTRAMYVDVTKRNQTERKFQGLLESAPDAIVIVNKLNRIVLVNAQTENMFGYTRDELLDQPLEILIPKRFHKIHGEHLAGYFSGSQVRPMGAGLELWARRRDGSEFSAEISLSPLETEEGLLVSSAIRDISKRKQAEVALRESESKFRNIIEASPLGMHLYQLDPDGRLLFMEANPAADEIIGVDHDQFVGKTFEQAFPEIGATDLPKHFRQVAANGGMWSTDQLRFEGESFSGVYEVNTFQTSPGKIVAAFRNVTKRKQIEEEQIRLIEMTERQREQLRILARQLIVAQETERKDLARELHDRVGQNLAALDFNLNRIRTLQAFDAPASTPIHQLIELVDNSSAILAQTGESMRDVMAELRPPMLDDFGLMAALEWYGSQFVAPRGIAVTVSGEELVRRLAPEVELAFFRIAQEAFTNIFKHAQATTVTVRLETEPDRDIVRLVVADNGGGFEPTSLAGPADRQSWGLIGMQERAEAVAAHCRIESIPGQGTQVIVEVSR